MDYDRLYAYLEAYKHEHPEIEMDTAELTRRVMALRDKVMRPPLVIKRIDLGQPSTILYRARFSFSIRPTPPPQSPTLSDEV